MYLFRYYVQFTAVIVCIGYETEEDDESDVEICRKLRKKRGKSVSSGSRGKSLCQPDSDDQQDFR